MVIDDHVIKLFQNGEIIRDTTQAWLDRFWTAGATIHAWQYFNNYIFIPIQNYLANTFVNGVPLKNTIKYIVLCKGIPIRIQSRIDGSGIGFYSRWNVALDPLLCYLNQEDQQFSILNLFNTSYSSHPNPYRYQDPLLNFSYRFQSHQFPIDGTNLKLSYLVSRLDGLTQDKVTDLITNSKNADHSGTGTFIFDSHPFPTSPSLNSYNQILESAHNILVSLGFNSIYDNYSPNPIYTSTNPILGYISWGVHSGLPTGYVLDNLSFTFKPGAIVNTLESFNGSTMGLKYSDRNIRRAGQGLISEFIYAGSSSGPCHTWEPYLSMAVRANYTYTKYAMGYNLVDAIYLGMPTLGWQNVVIGDPLTTIAWGKQSLNSNLNWSGTNLVTGEVNILSGRILNIANNSTINLRHQGFITGDGELVVGQNVVFNIYSWQKGVFLSYDGDSPRLVWGSHPNLSPLVYYKVYRKVGTGNWSLLTTTTALQYVDTQIIFNTIGDSETNVFYKVLAYSELPATDESNIISCSGRKNPRKEISDQSLVAPMEYSLEQNYPNPFNPTTQINYSIKEAGLVQLKVYDILGKEIATLVNENKEAGSYSVDFNAAELPSGVYIYQLTTPGFTQARKMILAK